MVKLGGTRIDGVWGGVFLDYLMYHDVSANLRHPSSKKWAAPWRVGGPKNCRDISEPNSLTDLDIYKYRYLGYSAKSCPLVGQTGISGKLLNTAGISGKATVAQQLQFRKTNQPSSVAESSCKCRQLPSGNDLQFAMFATCKITIFIGKSSNSSWAISHSYATLL